jgi:hypothetical protein
MKDPQIILKWLLNLFRICLEIIWACLAKEKKIAGKSVG